MKLKSILIFTLLVVSTSGIAQPKSSPAPDLQTLPEKILVETIVQGVNQASTFHEAWQFLANLAQTSRQFTALTRDRAIIDALAEKITQVTDDPTRLLLDFAQAKTKGKIGENTVKMIIDALQKAGARFKEQGLAALINAAENDNEEVVKGLLNAGVDVNEKQYGDTPLIRATLQNHEGIVKILLNAGAKVDEPSASKMTPLLIAARRGNEKIVEELLNAGADKEKFGTYEFDGTALMYAARKGHEGTMRTLIKAGADMDKQNSLGTTALMHAAMMSQEGAVRELLKAGADIEKQNRRGSTVLDSGEVPDRIKEIIQEGIEKRRQIKELKPSVFQQIDTIDKIQQEILDLNNKYRIAQQQQKADEAQEAQQHLIAQERNLKFKLDQFKQLMSNVTMNLTDAYGNTPLHKAVQSGNLKLVEWIFQFQPELAKRKNKAGQTPIELAAGRPQILKLFIGLKQ